MTVKAFALYGSRARGDSEPSSDIDILLVTSEESHRHIKMGDVSMSFYSKNDLIKRAVGGDLFVCHIVKESKPLYDPNNFFKTLSFKFRLKKSYSKERQDAADLGWFLARFGEQLPNTSLVSKRITWCVRTILIANSAEAGMPVFSATELSKGRSATIIRRLIAEKDSQNPNRSTIKNLVAFLKAQGTSDPLPEAMSIKSYQAYFKKKKHKVALQTFSAIDTDY